MTALIIEELPSNNLPRNVENIFIYISSDGYCLSGTDVETKSKSGAKEKKRRLVEV